MNDFPTYLAELVHRPGSDFGYTEAFGLGARGVWIDQNKDGKNYTWLVKWPANMTQDLVSFTNSKGAINKSDLEFAALVLQEAVFSSISVSLAWQTA